MKKISSDGLKKLNRISTTVLIICYISFVSINILYRQISQIVLDYWMVIPIIISSVTIAVIKFKKNKYLNDFCLLSLVGVPVFITLMLLKVDYLKSKLVGMEELLIMVLIGASLIISLSFLFEKKSASGVVMKKEEEIEHLFNLFYVNTSKVHEIAMLIDNKIMKTVESNQTSESLLRHDGKVNIGLLENNKIDYGYVVENNEKKNVYESFDVKTTKSIMLRKIYSVLANNKVKHELKLGKVILFNNVELKQVNTDDTVFAMNVLKDTNMKNRSEDGSVELNLSKIIDEMLEDFSIDYSFVYNGMTYLIQIPFKAKSHFENNYSHSDLQLGRLSIIGIYRGEIDFDSIKSISSKFLEIFSESYKNELNKVEKMSDYTLNNSSSKHKTNESNMPFVIKGSKALGKKHLIDLIAIIQEIQISEGEEADE